MSCYFFYKEESSPNKFLPLLNNHQVKVSRYFNCNVDLRDISNNVTHIFIDNISLLGNSLEEILDCLKAIFENGTSLIYPDRFNLRTVSEFNHFEIGFFYLVSQAIKNSHKEKIKEGIDLAKSEGIKMGRKRVIDKDIVANYFGQGLSIRAISELTGYSITSVWRYKNSQTS